MEVLGRKTYGIGVMYIYGPEFAEQIIPSPLLFGKEERTHLIRLYREIAKQPLLPISDAIHQKARSELDQVVFDVLKLTRGERDAVYEAVVELVKKRLEKAGSV
jgi:hypothetical protein